MAAAKVIMIVILFLTINPRTGQSDGCYCRRPNHNNHCIIPGCSNGTNAQCNTGKYYDNRYAAIGLGSTYRGCNCPGNPFNVNFNAVYNTVVPLHIYMYNYTNCTEFGLNARTDGESTNGDQLQLIECWRNKPNPSYFSKPASNELKNNIFRTVQYAKFGVPSCHRDSNESISVGKNLVSFLSTYMPHLQTLRLWRPDDFPWTS
ncbi:unnamed protein product, partial [Rotaria magnacalcarata]